MLETAQQITKDARSSCDSLPNADQSAIERALAQLHVVIAALNSLSHSGLTKAEIVELHQYTEGHCARSSFPHHHTY